MYEILYKPRSYYENNLYLIKQSHIINFSQANELDN
jgi:hypothetical protein